jgi:SHS2 domain-containing protein
MENEAGYRFLEHVSDALIEAYGRSLEEAFEQAALAMFQTMVETDSVSGIFHEDVDLRAEDELALLYSWLEHLLVRSEVNRRVYSKFKVFPIKQTPSGLELRAEIEGDSLNLEAHSPKVEVKAVTYHQMKIWKEGDLTFVRFLLDL